jgi:hypothetical protein
VAEAGFPRLTTRRWHICAVRLFVRQLKRRSLLTEEARAHRDQEGPHPLTRTSEGWHVIAGSDSRLPLSSMAAEEVFMSRPCEGAQHVGVHLGAPWERNNYERVYDNGSDDATHAARMDLRLA